MNRRELAEEGEGAARKRRVVMLETERFVGATSAFGSVDPAAPRNAGRAARGAE